MSQYHKFVLDVNNNISNLKSCPNVSNKIDYTNIGIFPTLGSVLPEKEGIPDLAIWPIIFYLLCAVVCLTFSFTYHWFQCMNNKLYKILQRLDMSGITICMFGSVTGILYYAYYCDPVKRNLWIMVQFIVLFGAFVLTTTQDWINEDRYVKVKASMFVMCGLFGGLVFFMLGFDSYNAGPITNALPFSKALWYVIALGSTYIPGAILFMFKFPENMFPGYFNVINSHAIWHCLVFAGTIIQTLVVLDCYSNRVAMKCLNIP